MKLYWMYLALLGAIVFEVAGTMLLRQTDQFSRLWPTAGTVVCYVTSFYFLSFTLKTIPVGIAYAIWSGLGMVLILLVGWVLFKQKLDAPALMGMGLIIAGVLVMNLFSKGIPHG